MRSHLQLHAFFAVGKRLTLCAVPAGKAVNELKAPKQRANDDEKLYVRRPVREEELRPAPPPSRKANNAPKPQPPPPL